MADSSLALNFPPDVYWTVDEFSNVLIVDRLRGWCRFSGRYRLYIDTCTLPSPATLVHRSLAWQHTNQQQLPCYETLRDMALAIMEKCWCEANDWFQQIIACSGPGQQSTWISAPFSIGNHIGVPKRLHLDRHPGDRGSHHGGPH